MDPSGYKWIVFATKNRRIETALLCTLMDCLIEVESYVGRCMVICKRGVELLSVVTCESGGRCFKLYGDLVVSRKRHVGLSGYEGWVRLHDRLAGERPVLGAAILSVVWSKVMRESVWMIYTYSEYIYTW